MLIDIGIYDYSTIYVAVRIKSKYDKELVT